MSEKDGFYVMILSYEDKDYRHPVGPMASRHEAERVDRGANINLNHDKFYTIIEDPHGYKENPDEYNSQHTIINGVAHPNGPRGLR